MDVLFRVADPGGLRSSQRVSTIPIPRREPGGDNPHPRPNRSPRNCHPSAGGRPQARKWPVLVLPGLSLGLGHGSRYFEGRRKPDARRRTGNTVAVAPAFLRWPLVRWPRRPSNWRLNGSGQRNRPSRGPEDVQGGGTDTRTARTGGGGAVSPV